MKLRNSRPTKSSSPIITSHFSIKYSFSFSCSFSIRRIIIQLPWHIRKSKKNDNQKYRMSTCYTQRKVHGQSLIGKGWERLFCSYNWISKSLKDYLDVRQLQLNDVYNTTEIFEKRTTKKVNIFNSYCIINIVQGVQSMRR